MSTADDAAGTPCGTHGDALDGVFGSTPRAIPHRGARAVPAGPPGPDRDPHPGSAPDRASGSAPAPGPAADTTPVLAAGCVLWRRSPAGDGLELCLVHRPKYDDWSHPKGKLKRGEDPLTGALREVEEETGHRAVPGARLPTVDYEAGGRPKQVRYWAAEAVSGSFAPNDEVDRLLWLPPPAARDRLTQPRDRTLVDALLRVLHLA